MRLVEFLIGAEQFPIYREISEREEELLRALLGKDFHFVLEDGEPMDELLFDVLAKFGASFDFFFSPPADAAVSGTFELRDAEVPSAVGVEGFSTPRRRPTTH